MSRAQRSHASTSSLVISLLLLAGCSVGTIGDPPLARTLASDARASVEDDAATPVDDGGFTHDDAGQLTHPDAAPIDGGDAGPSCEAETNAELCARLGATCGPLAGIDNCGATRDVASCGGCTSPDTCGGGGTANACGTMCTPEPDVDLCARLGATCGPLSATDNCGMPRDVASCGACPLAVAPTFSPPPGPITAPVQVTITSPTPSATLHYTLDGTTPAPGGATTHVYAGPVTVRPGVLLRALAQATGYTRSAVTDGYYEGVVVDVPIGVNVTWFNAWNESQPLANVASTARSTNGPLLLDGNNEPRTDFELMIYEGNTPGGPGPGGGAQFGVHQGRFRGQATLTAGGATLSNVRYDATANLTTFTLTTSRATNTQLQFTNTRRRPNDAPGNGVRELAIMRPGHNFGDVLNTRFTEAMQPFSVFRVGPQWTAWTYQTTPPVWANRAKPGGSFNTTDGDFQGHGAPWETLAAMANALGRDVWICLPPNADDDYLRSIFRVFFYGSDGVNPYTSPQASPTWRPLDPQRKLYFEIGNEIWNGVMPYVDITNQFRDLARAEVNAGDPNHFTYAHSNPRDSLLPRLYYGIKMKRASELARSIVGDANMMTRFRPVVSAQAANVEVGLTTLSYLMVVHGGHDFYASATADGHLRGEFRTTLVTPEDGVSLNAYGNVAYPLSHWIYGYAVAPYIRGANVAALNTALDSYGKMEMSANIQIARAAGVEPMAYEGGLENYPGYQDAGLDTLIQEQLDYWFTEGGGSFAWFSLAGHNGSGLIPDLTRQSPNDWPKMRGIYLAKGWPMPP